MSEFRLRIKIDGNEFEAEGAAETVERQFEAFKRLIAPPPIEPVPVVISTAPAPEQSSKAEEPAQSAVERIMRVEGRIVWLSVKAKADDAVLLILLGQKHFRRNEVVNGGEIMNGLRGSGIHIRRADGILARHAREGLIIVVGTLRGRRYRLSTDGVLRAQRVASELIPQVLTEAVIHPDGKP